jgi:hypothetical protein
MNNTIRSGSSKGLLDGKNDAPPLECALTAGVPFVTGIVRHFPKLATKDDVVITTAQFALPVPAQL